MNLQDAHSSAPSRPDTDDRADSCTQEHQNHNVKCFSFQISAFPDLSGRTLAAHRTDLHGLAVWLRDQPEYASKADCPLVSFAEFGDQRTTAGSLRHTGNIQCHHGAVGDYDGGHMAPADAAALLTAHGIAAVIATTPSHGQPGKGHRWRVFAPFTQPANTDQFRAHTGRLNAALGGVLAAESFTAAQGFYFGRVAGVPYEVHTSRGEPVDVASRAQHLEPVMPASASNGPSTDRTSAANDGFAMRRHEARGGLEQVREWLHAIPNVSEDWHAWNHVLMAVYRATNGSDEGLELAQEWSDRGPVAVPTDSVEGRWLHFHRSPPTEVGAATLAHMAAEAGGGTVATGSTAAAANEWPEAVDLFANLEPAPFPVALMPAVVRDFAQDQAALMGVDPSIVAGTALTVIAACTDDRIKVQPKRHDPTWTESARLWFGAIGDPSAKKSPAQAKAMGPAQAVDGDWREESAALQRAYENDLTKWQDDGGHGEPPAEPLLKRLMFSDVTVEKMADVLARCEPRGALVYRDELTGWLASMDAYKSGAGKDRAAWLEAYNGGPMSVDRIGRGSTYVRNWSACVIGGIQPDVIQQYAAATNHDGMLQRFILLHARPATRGEDRRPDMAAMDRYWATVRRAADLEPGQSGVTLSDEAHTVRETLWDRLHRATASHPNKFLTAALGKWEGLSARLMLTFHTAECAALGAHPSSRPISGATAEAAATFMWDCLLPHAARFYGHLDPVGDKARKVAALLLAHETDKFTVRRYLDRNLSESRRWKPWETDETMQRLESFGWILPDGRLNERGRPVGYLVNPSVHQRFAGVAEQEKLRREEITKLLRELHT